MKLVRRRDYKTKGRLGFEGLYLQDSGFLNDKLINYSINRQNKSLMIKIARNKKSASHKVTHNITRSGKKVPAICIKNKEISSFIKDNSNLEILIFNGIIIVAAKDSNRNVIISQALIAHNKSLKENIKRVFNSLVKLGLIDDSLLLNEFEDYENRDTQFPMNNIMRIPKKVFNKLKTSFRTTIYKNYEKRNVFESVSSNSLVLLSIIKYKREPVTEPDEDESILESFIGENYYALNRFSNIYSSYINHISYLYGHHTYIFIMSALLLKNSCTIYIGVIDSIGFMTRINLLLCFYKRFEYFQVEINTLILYLGFLFLDARKQINTLSPPVLSNIA